jgi:hypothetical protein
MAKINMQGTMSSAVTGVVFIAADAIDKSWKKNGVAAPLTLPFRRTLDWVGVVGVFGGALGVLNDYQPNLAEAVMYSSIPQLELSIWQLIRQQAGGTTQSRAGDRGGYVGRAQREAAAAARSQGVAGAAPPADQVLV